MGKQVNKTNVRQASSRSLRSKALPNPVKTQKKSYQFSKTPKIEASLKLKKSPLKISSNSKNIKKSNKKIVNDDKTRKVVELENKIEVMNKKIKEAETLKKVAPKKVASKSNGKNVTRRSSRGSPGKVEFKTKVKSSNDQKADSRDNVVRKDQFKSTPKSKEVLKKLPVKKCNPKPSKSVVSNKVLSKGKFKSKPPIKKVAVIGSKKSGKQPVKSKVKRVESKTKFTSRKRKLDNADIEDDVPGQKVAYIHVGEGGERDLEEHLRGSSRVNIQILSTERLPDIDDSDMIHGLDHSGTSRDYVDDRHRCTVRCPVGCQGHLRPNEIVIYESVRYEGRLLGRRRMKGRFVEGEPGDQVVAALEMTDFRRIGGRGNRRRVTDRNHRRRMLTQQRYRRAIEEDRNDSPIPPIPSKLGDTSGLPQRLSILLDIPHVSREVAEEHAWNTNDRSFNIVLKEDDPLTMRRHPVAQSTDCIRGKFGYSSGLHLWEVTWPVRQRGTHAVVGVATREAVLHSVGYQSLVGNTEFSWGWDLGRKKAYYDSRANEGTNYPPTITHHHQWTVPDTFNMVLDMDTGKMGFVVGNQFLGWSHTSVKTGQRVYPIVSTVWGHCEVKLRYVGGLECGVIGLQELARGAIRNSLGRDRDEMERSVETFSLPTQIKNYLKNY